MWTYVAGPASLQNVDWALDREFLLANGLGGYSASSILGCNTRRYHGLLVSALRPPVDRFVLLSHLDERLVLPGDQQIYLNTTEYRDGFYPDGFQHLVEFRLDPLPAWRWRVGRLEISKRLLLVHGSDCLMLHYAASGDAAGARLVLSPFVAMRSFHELKPERPGISVEPSPAGNGFLVRPEQAGPRLTIHFSAGQSRVDPAWYSRVYHRREQERGQDCLEDLLRVGSLTLDLSAGIQLTLRAFLGSDDVPQTFDEAHDTEIFRRRELLRTAEPRDQREQALAVAADQFLVHREHRGRRLASILAGYPWFADWGRDVMISLPGICLATGRPELARAVLDLYAGLVDQGMLPNRFEEDGRQLSYNSVDSALWFVQAAAELLRLTGDLDFLRQKLWPAVCRIIDRYHDGTRYHIHAEPDGLLWTGDQATQLTWMDAKHGDVVFTPRYGKPVEINALWISALYLADEWAARLGLPAPMAAARRDQARDSFRAAFWNQHTGCLHDCLSDTGPDARIRPNQLLAVSLPHAPIDGDRARSVVRVAREKLLTPRGLRTLAPGEPGYRGKYEGNWFERDSAYHQGTVWPWLLGPYVDALMASAEIPSLAHHEAQDVINTALATLDDGTIGTIGEIFDGDAPHISRGCFAQAWSVAEILRVKRKYEL